MSTIRLGSSFGRVFGVELSHWLASGANARYPIPTARLVRCFVLERQNGPSTPTQSDHRRVSLPPIRSTEGVLPDHRQTRQDVIKPRAGFLAVEQPRPASLLRILLIIAGIETNPGPGPKWPCTTCGKSAARGSVLCTKCDQWVHLGNCSGVRTKREYDSANYTCPACRRTTPPANVTSPDVEFNLLQLNANGISNKLTEIADFMRRHNISVAAIQETKLPQNSKPTVPGYEVVPSSRSGHGGGLAFIISNSVDYTNMRLPTINDPHIEQQGITIKSKTKSDLHLINIYVPPRSSCNPGYHASIAHLLTTTDTIIMGDINAHSPVWHSTTSDTRGTELATEIEDADWGLLNTEQSTRVFGGLSTSPDVTIATPNLLLAADWKAHMTLGSDHLPIVISLSANLVLRTSRKTTFVNIKKANWEAFKEESERLFKTMHISSECSAPEMERQFSGIIRNVGKRHIPSGRRVLHMPCVPEAAKPLIKERDELRQADSNNRRITDINIEITRLITEEKRSRWQSFAGNIDHRTESRKLWRVIKSLDGRKRTTDNGPIKFGNEEISRPHQIARLFNRQFTTVRQHTSDKRKRKIVREIKRRPINNSQEFTVHQVTRAVKSANNSPSFGPDGITMLHLKHLGTTGLNILTGLINRSISSCKVPAIWKKATIIPIHKAGKDTTQSSSYRPVSLLCATAKIIEALIQPTIVEHLPPADHQHGFRRLHSTTSALINISEKISEGFNKKKPPSRTIIAALDLTKAFDSVDITLLLEILLRSALPNNILRWLSSYLQGRQACTSFRDKTSKYRMIHTGVPQGSVISPALFNAYISDLPERPQGVSVVSYADDITAYTAGTDIDAASLDLSNYLDSLHALLEQRKLTLSATKSTVTLITPDTAQAKRHPPVKINNTQLPLSKEPKILGVTFDTMNTFGAHARQIAARVTRRNSVLRALTGTNWGQHKESLLTIYKTFGRSVINYAAPVWSTNLADSHFNRLQTAQNAALRAITGCHRMSAVHHLHQECSIMPVKHHNEMLAAQYLAATQAPDHPCHVHSNPTPGPRDRRQSLNTSSSANVVAARAKLPIDHSIADVLKQLHTDHVAKSISSLDNNKVLGAKPPPISGAERSLPRGARTVLAQLRSSYCSRLMSYKKRLNTNINDICPDCNGTPHDVIHLFNCPANPTSLTVDDLWQRPVEAARFLSL